MTKKTGSMPKVAFIGLGTMGAPMARRLLDAGYEVTVHNRTRSREEPLAAAGAARASSPKEAAQAAEVVLLMVSDSTDVEAVVLGDDAVGNGAAADFAAIHGMSAGNILVDLSTISPKVTERIATTLAEHNIAMLDAPVSGGSEGAEQGTLSIMVGGEAEALETVMPILSHLGKTITHVGKSGSGQVAKAINQVIIAGTYAAVAEGMALGLAAGVDMSAVHAAVSGGAAGSWVLEHRAKNMLVNEYPLGFRTRLHRKDLGIALATAEDLGVPMAVAAYVAQLETSLLKRGYGDEDMSNIARVVREGAGLD